MIRQGSDTFGHTGLIKVFFFNKNDDLERVRRVTGCLQRFHVEFIAIQRQRLTANLIHRFLRTKESPVVRPVTRLLRRNAVADRALKFTVTGPGP